MAAIKSSSFALLTRRLPYFTLLALDAAVMSPRLAMADATISSSTSAPLTTATANGGAADNIVVSGSVTVASGAAVTVNSSNTLTNSGTISSQAASGGIAVLIDGTGGIATAFGNTGTISVTGTGGSGNIGILVTGGPINGSIAAGSTSTLSVAGDNAIGLSVLGNITGNVAVNNATVTGLNSRAISLNGIIGGTVSLSGTSTAIATQSAAGVAATASGDITVLLGGSIGGTVTNLGALTSGYDHVINSSGALVPAIPAVATVQISGNLSQGFVNDRYYNDSTGARVAPANVDTTKDTLITGTITAYGGAPAILVAPETGNPRNVIVGVAGAGDDGYGIVNRGIVQTIADDSGVNATAVKISGATINNAAYTASIAGFISQSTASLTAATVDGVSTAIDVANGGSVTSIRNDGTLTSTATVKAATTSTAAGPGGAAYGLLIEAGGNVATFVNNGTFTVTSAGDNHSAYAVQDLSGALSNIVNTGTISAIAGAATGAVTDAFELSGSAANIEFSNSGTIAGNIFFGSGNDTLTATGGTITGTVAFGAGQNKLVMSNGAAITGPVTTSGGLDLVMSGTSSLDITKGAPALTSLVVSDNATLRVAAQSSQPSLSVSGAASLTGNSKLGITISDLVGTQSITLISAAGGLTTDHASSLVSNAVVPYLYVIDGTHVDAASVSVDLRRKTANALGFTAGQAAFFNQSLAVMAADSNISAAIGNLPDQASFLNAYRQIAPANYGSNVLRTAQQTQNAGFTAAGERMNLLREVREDSENRDSTSGFWFQEIYNHMRQSDSQSDPGYQGDVFGLALGGDMPLLGLDAVGVSFTANWSELHIDGVSGRPLDTTTEQLDLYATQSWKDFYLQATAALGHNSYNSAKTLSIGDLSLNQKAKWTGWQYGGNLTAGYNLNLGRFAIRPSTTLSYLHLHQGSFIESGAGSLDLAVNGSTITSFADTTQLAIDYFHPWGAGRLKAEARAAYVAEFDPKELVTSAQFVAAGDRFDLTADPIAAHEVQAGTSLGYLADDWGLSLGYDLRSATGFENHTVSFVVRGQF